MNQHIEITLHGGHPFWFAAALLFGQQQLQDRIIFLSYVSKRSEFWDDIELA
jgi:hypothetical protein